MTPETAFALCRFTHDSAILVLWGAFAFLAALVPAGLRSKIETQLSPLRWTAVVLAVVTTLLAPPIQASAVGEGWGEAIDPTTLEGLLLETTIGSAWTAQFITAALLAASLAIPQRGRPAATASAAGLSIAALAFGGHATMHEGVLGVLHRADDVLHGLAAGAWLGALVPLLPILNALQRPDLARDSALALRRFSSAGHGAVAVVIATGCINTGLVLGRWPTDWTSPYEALLALKIVVVAIMIGLAVFNRYALVPRIAGDRERSLRVLRLTTVAEIGLGWAAIACVSAFGLWEPG